ncbi:MAG: carbohydrate binding domain-containing protein [Gaiellaceae bacterium]
MRMRIFLSVALALAVLCSLAPASSPLPGSRLAREAAAAIDPVANPKPASTLLAPGTTALDLSVESAVATDCAWSLGTAKSYPDMTPFSSGAGTTNHGVRVAGLDPSPAVLNHVYVRCASNPDFVLALEYRSLATVDPSFPRTGNLWGWGDSWNKSPAYLARTDLWVAYGDVDAARAQQIRALNPNVLVLNSINAVEAGGLPEDYYLHDIHGKKIEVWPGSYRLNLTKSYVADYQAHAAYDLLLKDNLLCDGMFFDNVMTTQSWQTKDIYGNPFVVDANDDGKPDDLTAFDAAWKTGVFQEIREFRSLMPNAIVSGHSMNITEPGISQLFNGLSIGFRPADVLEHEMSFGDLWDEYSSWMTEALSPHVTMLEASPPDQIAYGYGYLPWKFIPASTLEFARTLYPYMRFGLGLALMNDGYFAYEFGDTWHGNDWRYDELNFNLGYPRGPARAIKVGAPVKEALLAGGGFERDAVAGEGWSLWADTDNGYRASAHIDGSSPGAGASSARVDVTATAGVDWHVSLSSNGVSVKKGKSYDIAFLARADKARQISVAIQKGSPDWRQYGGWYTFNLSPGWKRYHLSFESSGTDSKAQVEFMLGATTGSVWIDDVHFFPHRQVIYRREFDHGLVLLNPNWQTRRITVGKGWRRLKGSQAPRWELMADDSEPGFKAPKRAQVKAFDSGESTALGPFFHSWKGKVHLLPVRTSASWRLTIPGANVYSIDAWWPAAPAAKGWSRAARYEVYVNGRRVATRKLDQSSGGDRWHRVARLRLPAGKLTVVRLVCADTRPCAADALYLRSKARYNDGSVAKKVVLAPMDAIVLRRAP